MKEIFNLIDGSEKTWKLGKVTPRREKLFTELGLIRENTDPDDKNNFDAVLKKILDGLGDDLLKLLNGLFEGDKIEKEQLEDLDKTEVKVAVFSFFMRDLELFNQFGSLMPILTSLKSATAKSDSSEA